MAVRRNSRGSAPLDNPAFRRWFGDSKVVDKTGGPLVVYHGTSADFSRFDPLTDPINDEGYLGVGSYFDTDRGRAAQYALMASDATGGRPKVLSAYLRIANPYVPSSKDLVTQGMSRAEASRWTREIVSRGFDGVRNFAGTEWVVFDPDDVVILDSSDVEDPEPPRAAKNSSSRSSASSAAFKRWFGDSVAVSDRDGEPLVVYHGGFDVIGSQAGSFRPSRAGRWGAGIYFTPFRFKAEHYAEDWAMDEGRPGTVGAYYLRIERPFVVGQGDAYKDGMVELLQAVRESGEHDGIVVLDTTGPSGRTMRMGRNVEEIVVFSPKQVKAAFDNDGAFDRDSADVRKNPVDSLLVSQLAPQDVKRLNAMEAEWLRYMELADLAYEAGLTDEGDELSEAADAAADRLEYVASAIEESEASDHAEHELEGALFNAYEDFRRGGPTMGLSSEDELAKHARWHFSEHGVIVDSVSDRDIVDAVYDVWLWRKKLLNRVRR